jgi:hypothetical protein
MASVERPDERTLTAELDGVRFLCGAAEGRWSVLAFQFPDLYVRVVARRDTVCLEQDFHLRCDGYPDPGPFIEAWSFEKGCRPDPPADGSPGFRDALKHWEASSGVHGGIYRAWQRHAATHNAWAALRPDQAWNSRRDITFVLEKLYELVSEQVDWLAARRAA